MDWLLHESGTSSIASAQQYDSEGAEVFENGLVIRGPDCYYEQFFVTAATMFLSERGINQCVQLRRL